ncbi:Permease of the drug/metabolite transporter (DMT) superfamily [Micromonospora pattaloongensis]|uniref:Permease of the drug/metabolite transporter (DMT) superfamily n=1 Tax=Micromonospora pattaloongensis TaxID=405436 RepID=A0A1H3MBL3_9ACTN|nr:DMT family transporter [Micromonospora pattaloongensis]SDY74110.1 Permease of the drug/metabolite transporter (DMT) superfamily [Micromonospora pattaloongensis]
MTSENLRATLLCVFGMVIVGSSVSLSQLILDYPPLTGQAARYALAALALFGIARVFPRLGAAAPAAHPTPPPGPRAGRRAPLRPRPSGTRPTPRERGILALLAATGLAAFNACILVALPHADAAAVGTVIGAAPLGLALLGPLLRGQRPTLRLVAAAGIVVAGTAAVQGAGRTDAVGLLAALGALGGEIAFSLLAAAVLPRLGPVRVAAHSCALAVPLLLVAAVPAGEPGRWRLPTPVEAATLGYLAAFMTVLAFLAWFTGLRRLGVERAGMIVGVMPLATLATAAVQAGRLPDPGQTLGVLVVALGLALGLTTRGGGQSVERSAARTASA